MPYANSQGVRIHYQVEGAGVPLVLQHGFTDSLESWYKQGYVEGLQDAYQLILIDARGHGASDKPHDPAAYDFQSNVADILAVLDALHIPTAHFLGYSMGGQIGFALAQYAAAGFSSLIVGGADPYRASSAEYESWFQILQQGGMAAFVQVWEQQVPVAPALRARLLANDAEAMIAYRVKRLEHPGFTEVLPTMTMPCLLYVGEADNRYAGVMACKADMPNVTFVSLPGLNHVEGFFRRDLVLPHITQFLATVVS
jgi:pimeloyl-ACP methyl ester carboxylesterase